ncbi:hypothetical protein CSA17_03170 [bacterium DOLJORAL78_65_58]|nr:MAG: hypothetical protein CSB20_03465 [bacterium DOLZORAL124_64_63]PIE76265.1 MAG: hypothetical protein CSA17_03170 [bacterium DOLJORAL78_65_58]
MTLDLNINGVALRPGVPVDPSDLRDNGFRKVGLLKRLVKRPPGGGDIFLAENCEATCFRGNFNLYPCTHSYLNRDRQWQTQATVQVVDGKVQRVTLQVLGGLYAAPNYMSKFEELCTQHMGQPQPSDSGALVWKKKKLALQGYLQRDRINADFIIEYQG